MGDLEDSLSEGYRKITLRRTFDEARLGFKEMLPDSSIFSATGPILKGHKHSPIGSGGDLWYEFPHPESRRVEESIVAKTIHEVRIPSLKDKVFELDLIRLVHCLQFWDLNSKTKVGNPLGILRENIRRGPYFADEATDVHNYSIKGTLNTAAEFCDYNEVTDAACYTLSSLDDVFSPKHLLHFKNIDKGDINLLANPRKVIDAQLLLDFKEAAKRFVRPWADRPEIDDLDRLKYLSASVGLAPSGKRVRKTLLRTLGSESLQPTRGKFTFSYVWVDKTPGEGRACLAADTGTLNALVLLEKMVHKCFDVPSDVYHSHDFSWLADYLEEGRYAFLQVDQKKCGLTFPQELLSALFEVGKESYPEWDWDLFQGYAGATVKFENRPDLIITEGVGLGMMNGAISAITAILFELFKEQKFPEEHLDAKFFNDDQVIRIPRKGDFVGFFVSRQAEITQSWIEHLSAYKLDVHTKKPFLSKSGVFLETYGYNHKFSTQKTTRLIPVIFKAFMSYNIAHAKAIVSAVVDALGDDDLKQKALPAIATMIRFWGYEFHKREALLPFQAGGWVRLSDLDLLDHMGEETSEEKLKMYNLMLVPFRKQHVGRFKKAVNQLKQKYSVFYKDRVFDPFFVDYSAIVRNVFNLVDTAGWRMKKWWDIYMSDRSAMMKRKNLEPLDPASLLYLTDIGKKIPIHPFGVRGEYVEVLADRNNYSSPVSYETHPTDLLRASIVTSGEAEVLGIKIQLPRDRNGFFVGPERLARAYADAVAPGCAIPAQIMSWGRIVPSETWSLIRDRGWMTRIRYHPAGMDPILKKVPGWTEKDEVLLYPLRDGPYAVWLPRYVIGLCRQAKDDMAALLWPSLAEKGYSPFEADSFIREDVSRLLREEINRAPKPQLARETEDEIEESNQAYLDLITQLDAIRQHVRLDIDDESVDVRLNLLRQFQPDPGGTEEDALDEGISLFD